MFELIDKVTFCNCKQSTIIDYTFKLMKLWSSLVKWYKLLKQQEKRKLEALITMKQMIKKLKALFSDKSIFLIFQNVLDRYVQSYLILMSELIDMVTFCFCKAL